MTEQIHRERVAIQALVEQSAAEATSGAEARQQAPEVSPDRPVGHQGVVVLWGAAGRKEAEATQLGGRMAAEARPARASP